MHAELSNVLKMGQPFMLEIQIEVEEEGRIMEASTRIVFSVQAYYNGGRDGID